MPENVRAETMDSAMARGFDDDLRSEVKKTGQCVNDRKAALGFRLELRTLLREVKEADERGDFSPHLHASDNLVADGAVTDNGNAGWYH